MVRVLLLVVAVAVGGCVSPGGSGPTHGFNGDKADSLETPDEVRDTHVGEHRGEEPLGANPIGFAFVGAADTAVTVGASAGEAELSVEVWGPAAEVLPDGDAEGHAWGHRLGSDTAAPARIPRIILPADGTYLIVVSGAGEEPVESFDFALDAVQKVVTPIVLHSYVHGRRVYDDRDRGEETWRDACRQWRDDMTAQIAATYGPVQIAPPVVDGVEPEPFEPGDAVLVADGCERDELDLSDYADAGNVYNFAGTAQLVFEVRNWDSLAAIFPADVVGDERQSNDDDPASAIDSYQQACDARIEEARATYGKRFVVGACDEPVDVERSTRNVWQYAGRLRLWLHSDPEWDTRIEVPGFIAGRRDNGHGRGYRSAHDSWLDACEGFVASTAEADASTAAVVVDRRMEGYEGLGASAAAALADSGWFVVPSSRVSDEQAASLGHGDDAAAALRVELGVDMLLVVRDTSTDDVGALSLSMISDAEPVQRVVETTPEASTALLFDAIRATAPDAPNYARLEWHSCGSPEDWERSIGNTWQWASSPYAVFSIATDRHVVEKELVEIIASREVHDNLEYAIRLWVEACEGALDAARAEHGEDFVVGSCGVPEDTVPSGNSYRFRSTARAWVLSDEPAPEGDGA